MSLKTRRRSSTAAANLLEEKGNEITIYVKYINPYNCFGAEKLYEVDCLDTENLCEVRERVSRLYKINPDHLYFGGKEADDCATIASYQIHDHDTLDTTFNGADGRSVQGV